MPICKYYGRSSGLLSSSLLGVAVIALPSGVITASYLEELREEKRREEKIKKRKEKWQTI